MSQDNQTHIPDAHQASRRALLMGFAAVATPMAPALASALSESAPAAADPIFDAIAEHRRSLDHMFACYRTGRGLERGLPRLPAGIGALVSHRMEPRAARQLHRPSRVDRRATCDRRGRRSKKSRR
jgi:hypothetical protein